MCVRLENKEKQKLDPPRELEKIRGKEMVKAKVSSCKVGKT